MQPGLASIRAMEERAQKPARRHHLVSRFYLRHFADQHGTVTTVRLPGDRVFAQSVADASVQKDYYTAIGNDGHETDVAERAFNEIEGPASQAWNQIAAGVWPLPAPARGAAAAWIALHLLRGTRTRVSMNNLGTDLLQLQVIAGGRVRMRDVLRAMGEPHDDESVDNEWISWFQEPVFVEVNANHHLIHLTSLLPQVTESLLARLWVLTSFERKALATCDQPVFVVPNPDNASVGLGTGIENADTIHVPLTRRLSLTMALRATLPSEMPGQAADIRIAGVTATARYSNSCTLRSARSALFHHPDDQPLSGLDLKQPRDREVGRAGDPWRFMPKEDRQILLDAGLHPPGAALQAPLADEDVAPEQP
jgi:hypothetical protein